MNDQRPILEIRNLKVRYPVWGGLFRRKVREVDAVDNVSFKISPGETLGLVGESGCGKTTVALSIANVLRRMVPGVHTEGNIIFRTDDGPLDLFKLKRRGMRPHRGNIQMVFQDPYSSLNPRMTVNRILSDPMKIHNLYQGRERVDRVAYLLEKVGL